MDELLAEFSSSDPTTMFWLSVGFIGQLIFGSRFIVQWIVSERAGKSVIPLAFWFLSLGGNICILSYSIWRMDPVFILGSSFNFIIYTRNLMLIFRERSDEQPA